MRRLEALKKSKLKDEKGLTLVEMLCVIGLLVVVTGIVTTGIMFGVKNYSRTMTYIKAQQLCASLTTAVADELRYAGEGTKVNESGKITQFFSNSGGHGLLTGNIFKTDENGEIIVGTNSENESFYLLTSGSYQRDLKASLDVSYSEIEKYFQVDIKVYSTDENNPLKENTICVKPWNNIGSSQAQS